MSERKWDWPETPTARRNLETLSALARAIGMAAPGRFVLLLAKCNLPVQREALVERLRAMLEPLGVELMGVGLDEPVDDLLSHLEACSAPLERRPAPVGGQLTVQPQPAVAVAEPEASYSARPPLALSVHGLESSLRSDDPHPPLLTHLNLGRERYRDLGCPLVLWLPDYALTRLAREAPDFWAWRSGVFEFAPEPEVAESALRRMAYEPVLATSSLDAAAKRERVALLEQLLADYRELGEGPQERRAESDILHQLGMLHQVQGEYDRARELYEQSLAIKQELGDRAGMASSLHQLGNLHYLQGEYDRARELYEQSLAMAQELGDRAGLASSLHQLGMLHELQGEYDRARELYEQSLAIKQELGDRAGTASSLHQLGRLHELQGEYDRARELYEQSLAMAQELGDRAGLASSLHQLGMLHGLQGEYDRARELYEQSLAILQELGDRAGMAGSMHQLGMLHQYQGEYDRARQLYEQSLAMAQELGDRAGMAISLHQLGRLAEEIDSLEEAERLFSQSLATLEALRSPDAEIARRSLERVREHLEGQQRSEA